MRTTVGRLVIESILPKGFLDDYPRDRPLGHKDIENILQRVAEEKPELYKEVSHKLLRFGAKTSVETGSSFSVNDLDWPVDKASIMKKVEEEERKIFFNPDITQEEKENRLIALYAKYSSMMPDISFENSMKRGSNLARMVASGARGNKSQLNSNIGADFLVVDQNKKPVPIGIKRSFAEGLSLPEYFAGGYGARSGTIDGKFAVRDSGFLCLAEDTLVLMGDLSSKEIKDVLVGDVIWGSDTNGVVRKCKVTQRYHNGINRVYRFEKNRNGELMYLEATENHNVLTQKGVIKCSDAAALCWLVKDTTSEQSLLGECSTMVWDRIRFSGEKRTFDIEVDHPDHLFVLANGLIVSNSKQVGAVSMDLLVTEDDCKTKNGIPVPSEDKDSIGSILARDVNGYKAGTIITPKILKDIQSSKVDTIVVRSPITCQSSNGGLCSHCVGIREYNRLPKIGENVGLPAASALAEPLTQALLGSKHTAGVANAKRVSGFKSINAMFQVPDVFPYKATLSTKEGTIEKIEDLPQGGKHVFISGEAHYVPPNMEITKKIGDQVEPGDSITEGNVNPLEFTALRGIGQGRLNFVQGLKEAFAENGVIINRRNAELVARASIDHVQVNDADETSDYLPDEIVRYENFIKSYQPRENSYTVKPNEAIGKYLEKPFLHYSIGTKVTKRVADNLAKFGDNEVLVNDEEPSFSPKMVRLMDAPSYNEDWMAQLGTSYIQKNLKKNVTQGKSFSDIHGKHPIPALAYGKEFGKPPAGSVGY
jgi:DNA-directed RNA polymerase subunit beta'